MACLEGQLTLRLTPSGGRGECEPVEGSLIIIYMNVLNRHRSTWNKN